MIRGTVRVKLRPIKLAFLVNPEDKVSLRQAIEINTFLWGGVYNPIIPTYKELPVAWQDAPFVENPTAQELVSGYLDNFDPDYVIPMGECVDYAIDVGDFNKITDVSEILESMVDIDDAPTYGIGLFEVLSYFFEKELKFQRKYPLDICVPQFGDGFDLFFASVFGKLPENIDNLFWERVANHLEATKIDCSTANYIELLESSKIFLRRMTRLYLTHRGNYEMCVYFLDSTEPIDIIDYWNLRAVGWNVLAVPKQFSQEDTVQECVQGVIEENYDQPRANNKFYRPITLLKSRSVSEDELKQFADSFDSSLSDLPDKDKGPKYFFQTTYPRMWDEWARGYDHVECCEIESDTAEHDISTNETMIRVKTLDPEFFRHLFFGVGKPRFVNEFNLRLYGDKELLADVIPKGDLNLARVIGRYDPFSWRISRKGLVHLSKHSESVMELLVPYAESIFTRWLELQGWTVNLTSPGKIAKQMLHQLDGVHGTWILAQKGIIQLLGEMSSYTNILKKIPEELKKLQDALQQNGIQSSADEIEGFVKYLKEIEPQLAGDERPMLATTFWSKLSKIAGKALEKKEGESNEVRKQRIASLATQLRKKLIDSNVLQLGLEVQCTACNKRSWYSLKNMDYELRCPECHAHFSFSQNTENIEEAYRTLGAFSSSNQADGAYTVLLTLRFFSVLLEGATTPLMSFEVQKSETKLFEVDLGLFYQKSKFSESETKVILAECKTFNEFKQTDIDKMKELGNAFPGAILVFAKLTETLRDEEKEILIPFVKASWIRSEKRQPFNPVMILTGKELFLDLLWESHLDKVRFKDLLDICSLTQRVHLGKDFQAEQYNRIGQRVNRTSWSSIVRPSNIQNH